MNWMRTILDGFAMAAYFNLFAAAVALYNPRLMFPSYPPAIIKNAPEPPSKRRIAFTGYGSFLGNFCPSCSTGQSAWWKAAPMGFGRWR